MLSARPILINLTDPSKHNRANQKHIHLLMAIFSRQFSRLLLYLRAAVELCMAPWKRYDCVSPDWHLECHLRPEVGLIHLSQLRGRTCRYCRPPGQVLALYLVIFRCRADRSVSLKSCGASIFTERGRHARQVLVSTLCAWRKNAL